MVGSTAGTTCTSAKSTLRTTNKIGEIWATRRVLKCRSDGRQPESRALHRFGNGVPPDCLPKLRPKDKRTTASPFHDRGQCRCCMRLDSPKGMLLADMYAHTHTCEDTDSISRSHNIRCSLSARCSTTSASARSRRPSRCRFRRLCLREFRTRGRVRTSVPASPGESNPSRMKRVSAKVAERCPECALRPQAA